MLANASWATDAQPMIIRVRKYKTRWAVEFRVQKGKNIRTCHQFSDSRQSAEKLGVRMRQRFKKILTHVA